VFVIRKKLSADDTLIAFTRYNDITGKIQTTPNGGVTWIDNPCADTRTNVAYRLPARSGLTAKCDAATGIVESVRKIVALFLTGVIAFQFVNGAITILLVIVGIGLFVKLIFQLFNALLVIGAIAIDAAFNPTVWYEIKCIVNTNISANGIVTQAQFDAIYTQIAATKSNVVSTVWGAIVAVYGPVGMTNMGASYIAIPPSDCSECIEDLALIPAVGAEGTIIENLGNGWWQVTGYLRATDRAFGFIDANGNCINIDQITNANATFIARTNCANVYVAQGGNLSTGNYRLFYGTRTIAQGNPSALFHAFSS